MEMALLIRVLAFYARGITDQHMKVVDLIMVTAPISKQIAHSLSADTFHTPTLPTTTMQPQFTNDNLTATLNTFPTRIQELFTLLTSALS